MCDGSVEETGGGSGESDDGNVSGGGGGSVEESGGGSGEGDDGNVSGGSCNGEDSRPTDDDSVGASLYVDMLRKKSRQQH